MKKPTNHKSKLTGSYERGGVAETYEEMMAEMEAYKGSSMSKGRIVKAVRDGQKKNAEMVSAMQGSAYGQGRGDGNYDKGAKSISKPSTSADHAANRAAKAKQDQEDYNRRAKKK